MKKLAVLGLLLGVWFSGTVAQAATHSSEGGPFGLGIELGAPSAIVGNYWLDKRASVDMGLAFDLADYFLVYGDYLYHFPGAFGHENKFVAELSPYVGVGGLIAFATRTRYDNDHYIGTSTGSLGLALRVPLGIAWRPTQVPLEVFIELVPGISVIPATAGIIQGGIGIRYYF